MKRIVIAATMAFAAMSANAATELVKNGNFETGTFRGWTKSGNDDLSDVIANTVTSDHTYLWRSGAIGQSAFISQNLVTIAGQHYDLSFDVYNTATNHSSFEAWFGGTEVVSFSNEVHDWTHYDIDVVASGKKTKLKFGARNDPSFTRLDNVSVKAFSVPVPVPTPVPEPESFAMLLAGMGLLGLIGKRRKA